jgi:hypothetical protein
LPPATTTTPALPPVLAAARPSQITPHSLPPAEAEACDRLLSRNAEVAIWTLRLPLCLDLAVLEQDQGRDATDTETGWCLRIFVDVQLRDPEAAFVFMAASSRIGAIILQGPHHSAQKSSNTGSEDLSTSVSNVASDVWTISGLLTGRPP